MTQRAMLTATVIIVNWNRATDTLEAIRSSLDQTRPPDEIIVVDNASLDDSVELVRSNFPQVRLIALPENVGCPAGRNEGIDAASSDILFFLDDDGFYDPGVVEGVLEEFQRSPSLAAASFKVLSYPDGLTDPPPGGFGDWAETTCVVHAFRGGASAIRKSVLERVGLYPAEFFRQAEEQDLCLRIYDAGFHVRYLPAPTMHHKGSSYSHKNRVVTRYAMRNDLITVLKYFPLHLGVLFLPWKLLSHLRAVVRDGDIRDYFSVLLSLPRLWIRYRGHPKVQSRTVWIYQTLRYRPLASPDSLDSWSPGFWEFLRARREPGTTGAARDGGTPRG